MEILYIHNSFKGFQTNTIDFSILDIFRLISPLISVAVLGTI